MSTVEQRVDSERSEAVREMVRGYRLFYGDSRCDYTTDRFRVADRETAEVLFESGFVGAIVSDRAVIPSEVGMVTINAFLASEGDR